MPRGFGARRASAQVEVEEVGTKATQALPTGTANVAAASSVIWRYFGYEKNTVTQARYHAFSASGAPSPYTLINPCTRLAAGSVFSYVEDPAKRQRRATEVDYAIQAGWLRIPDGSTYELARAADAHSDVGEDMVLTASCT